MRYPIRRFVVSFFDGVLDAALFFGAAFCLAIFVVRLLALWLLK